MSTDKIILKHNDINDCFDDEALQFTEPTIIAGTGAAAAGLFGKLPDNLYKIALNGAIVEAANWNLWMCTTDEARIQDDYWKRGLELGVPSLMHAVMARIHVHDGGERRLRKLPSPTYTCTTRSMMKGILEPGTREFEAGASVAGACAGMLIRAGVKHIRLFGIDMTGTTHCDGTNTWITEGDVWKPRRYWFGQLIEEAAKYGVRFDSYTPTALDVPIVRL